MAETTTQTRRLKKMPQPAEWMVRASGPTASMPTAR